MNADSWAVGSERAKVHEIVDREPLPPGFEDVEVLLGLDQNNEPGVWLVFRQLPDQVPSTEAYSIARAFTHALRPKLLGEGIERWPYFRIKPSDASKPILRRS